MCTKGSVVPTLLMKAHCCCNRRLYIHVMGLATLRTLYTCRTVTARGKLAGVTNDKESVLLYIAVREPCLSG